MYVATHVAQTVLRLDAEGARTTLAGPDEGAVGSTACAFGRAPRDRQALYVTTNGGLSLPYEGKLQDAEAAPAGRWRARPASARHLNDPETLVAKISERDIYRSLRRPLPEARLTGLAAARDHER
jgi:hypothetical protein